MPAICTGRLCLLLLLSTLYLIASAAWFYFAIPAFMDQGSDIALFGAFSGTALWMVAGTSFLIYAIRKASPVGR